MVSSSNSAGNEAVRFIQAEWERIVSQLQLQHKRTYPEFKSVKNGPQYYTDKKAFYKEFEGFDLRKLQVQTGDH